MNRTATDRPIKGKGIERHSILVTAYCLRSGRSSSTVHAAVAARHSISGARHSISGGSWPSRARNKQAIVSATIYQRRRGLPALPENVMVRVDQLDQLRQADSARCCGTVQLSGTPCWAVQAVSAALWQHWCHRELQQALPVSPLTARIYLSLG
jgi:hypothetical protein